MAREQRARKIDGNGVVNVNRQRCSVESLQIFMLNWTRRILILFIATLAIALPYANAQTNPPISLTLIGYVGNQYVTPAGQTTELKMEILNLAPSSIYLLEGDAYLDPNLNGTWQLVHSESMDNFHLAYLQSAIWTFNLTVPQEIQATNSTNGLPQVYLLIKVDYSVAGGAQLEEQREFQLGVPGATIQTFNYSIWFALVVVIVAVAAILGYGVTKRRRKTLAP